MNTNFEALNTNLEGQGILSTIKHLVDQAIWLSDYDLERVEQIKESIRKTYGLPDGYQL